MEQFLQRRLPMVPPVVPAPPPFAERRLRTRRAIDAAANVEISFLAGAFDVLAGVGSAEERLAALLNLIAETAGAERAAVLADGGERRVAVSVQPDEDPADARRLAAWLDARAPRSRADRAASAPALVSLALAAGARADRDDPGAGVAADDAVADPTDPGEARDWGREARRRRNASRRSRRRCALRVRGDPDERNRRARLRLR